MMQMPIVRLYCPQCNTELQNTLMEYRCHLCAWEASVQPVTFPEAASSPPATIPRRPYQPALLIVGGGIGSNIEAATIVGGQCPIHGQYWSATGRCPNADASGGCSR